MSENEIRMQMNEGEITTKLFHWSAEIERIIREAMTPKLDEEGNPIFPDIKGLLELRRKMNEDLIAALHRQNREVAWFLGEPIEPMVHFGEAILLPSGGLG